MSDSEFFRFDQEQWYSEFMDAEVSEIMTSNIVHDENFDLDVPF